MVSQFRWTVNYEVRSVWECIRVCVCVCVCVCTFGRSLSLSLQNGLIMFSAERSHSQRFFSVERSRRLRFHSQQRRRGFILPKLVNFSFYGHEGETAVFSLLCPPREPCDVTTRLTIKTNRSNDYLTFNFVADGQFERRCLRLKIAAVFKRHFRRTRCIYESAGGVQSATVRPVACSTGRFRAVPERFPNGSRTVPERFPSGFPRLLFEVMQPERPLKYEYPQFRLLNPVPNCSLMTCGNYSGLCSL